MLATIPHITWLLLKETPASKSRLEVKFNTTYTCYQIFPNWQTKFCHWELLKKLLSLPDKGNFVLKYIKNVPFNMCLFSFTEFTSKNINMPNPTGVQTVTYLYTWKSCIIKVALSEHMKAFSFTQTRDFFILCRTNFTPVISLHSFIKMSFFVSNKAHTTELRAKDDHLQQHPI